MIQKICPIILRMRGEQLEILAFQHPDAGKQFVKGTIEENEQPIDAAHRELFEESGLRISTQFVPLGVSNEIVTDELWHFFATSIELSRNSWKFETLDDHGHTFKFLWRDFNETLDDDWHPVFHRVYDFIKQQQNELPR